MTHLLHQKYGAHGVYCILVSIQKRYYELKCDNKFWKFQRSNNVHNPLAKDQMLILEYFIIMRTIKTTFVCFLSQFLHFTAFQDSSTCFSKFINFFFRDMESLKSEMYSVKDQDGKLSLYDSVSQSIGDISSRMTSLKLKRIVG